ncbi:bifunctional 4-hydroxy-2-oxoglutarate aldolase/2-dehydro-3-deoxy-phosphogluconate aldolase [Paenibacillus chondroitinus]|uniref:Bifunctional 4-hydroxy-2-oxoglutarate aldolase/2-dehydro-3-deoxy-phosphogluconate aldolase n=1 Tax=Paenibacillus chondroitinus TaxID=59842 RepID=A0ABU6DMU4_9BACL|nr:MULTISPECIES: bifunctional 4-hydroxy-2-oxoglutarate aldolase/2-dehydro-3-deoxy-phosphogluconate aldolase [Paenibacillus]MCY9661444.1 bifunctional 4-hydroxy-2-oxoglutarate aldolase/2-dehydro-3-deoxy-phosphogluconate aldolase [Paenibacillus anseongense]MEB4799093.1 bifunctional 4-hydroxy-2-oxoglutarate aldolase/2-dehydro-3-deoxy-phosphogluconate aldolase [Paenibacillus chondroitinus]
MSLEVLQQLKKSKVIAIIRGIEPSQAQPLFEALESGGITLAEVTLNTPNALQIIQMMRKKYEGRMVIGAGTVLNAAYADEAIRAGAQFLISPNVDQGMIEKALASEVLPIPGALTPTEIVQAMNFGASTVKLFPCSSLGPSYLKEIKGPLNDVHLLAVGGITKDNAAAYLEAGAFSVGVGGSLVSLSEIQRGNYKAITTYAEQLVAAVNQ